MRFNSTLDKLFIFTVILFLSQISHARRNDVELFKDPQMLCILFFTMIGGVVICWVSLKISKFTQKKGNMAIFGDLFNRINGYCRYSLCTHFNNYFYF